MAEMPNPHPRGYQETEMESIVVRLLCGSHEYDIMRGEIKKITNLVCGLIKKRVFPGDKSDYISEVKVYHRDGPDGEICWELRVSPWLKEVYACVSYPGSNCFNTVDAIPLEYVKLVHGTLEGFVEKMIEPWPEIIPDLNLLLIAGDLALSKK